MERFKRFASEKFVRASVVERLKYSTAAKSLLFRPRLAAYFDVNVGHRLLKG